MHPEARLSNKDIERLSQWARSESELSRLPIMHQAGLTSANSFAKAGDLRSTAHLRLGLVIKKRSGGLSLPLTDYLASYLAGRYPELRRIGFRSSLGSNEHLCVGPSLTP